MSFFRCCKVTHFSVYLCVKFIYTAIIFTLIPFFMDDLIDGDGRFDNWLCFFDY